MYHLYFGNDRERVRDAVSSWIEMHGSPEMTVITLDADSYQPGVITDALGATSLFGGEQMYVIDTPSLLTDFEAEVLSSLEELGESSNTFLILEDSLLVAKQKQYEKYAEKIEEFKTEAGERFNSFALADALAAKDKRRLWVLLQEARLNGQREEEIIGILWWQLKSLRLAEETNSAAEAGMKDFPYNKAKRSLKNFPKEQEVISLSRSLLEIYHAGHAGLRDLDLALEEWVLML